jgi:hypothetical protein
VEAVDYLGAPVRHWVIVVSVAVLLAFAAVLIPVHAASKYPMTEWQANSEVGLIPQASSLNGLGARVNLQQLAYYAQQPAVLEAAAKSLGVADNAALASDLVVMKVKGKAKEGAGGNKLEIGIVQPTKKSSAQLTRSFATALGQYVNGRLTAQYQSQLKKDEARVTNLANEITNLRENPLGPVGTTTTTTPNSTTGTTTPTSSTTSTTAAKDPPATTTTTKAKDPTTTSTTSATTTTTIPGSGTAVQPTTTTTTVPKTVSGKAIRQREILDLADSYAGAVAKQQALVAQGVPSSGYAVLVPAKASSAIAIPGGPTLLAHRWVRLFLGLLIGLIIGVLISYLVEAFDRRLRSEARAAEAFGLPVIVKVPGIPPALRPSREPAVPVVDVVVAPQSSTAEAYRRLHVAIRTAPLVSWVRRFGPLLDVGSPGDLYPPGQLADPAAGDEGGAAGVSGVQATGNRLLPDRIPTGRTAILIASPRDEPTRSVAVANLAAVFAEAGQRVLVVTMGGLRTSSVLDGRSFLSAGDLGPDPDPSLIIASSRPSQLPGVSSLPLGQILENPSRLLAKAGALVRAAREVVDVVLFEASLLSTQDAEALLPFVDVVVVVGEFWYTKVGDARDSRRLLSRHRAQVLGLALTNEAPPGLAGLGFSGNSGSSTGPGGRRASPLREPVRAYSPRP